MITTLQGYMETDMTMTFGELAIGARFEFRGRRYEKVASEVGRDEERCGNVFHQATEVLKECGVWSVECGTSPVRSAVCGVRNAGSAGSREWQSLRAAGGGGLVGGGSQWHSESPMQQCWG